jgi:hypothetical protein
MGDAYGMESIPYCVELIPFSWSWNLPLLQGNRKWNIKPNAIWTNPGRKNRIPNTTIYTSMNEGKVVSVFLNGYG